MTIVCSCAAAIGKYQGTICFFKSCRSFHILQKSSLVCLLISLWPASVVSQTRKLLLDFVGQFLQPSQLAWVQAKMEAGIKKFQHVNDKGVDGVETPESGFGAAQIWNLCVFALVGYFALSCIHQFAKVSWSHKMTLFFQCKIPSSLEGMMEPRLQIFACQGWKR